MMDVRPYFTAWHGRSAEDRWCHTRTTARLDLETGAIDEAGALAKAKADADAAYDGLIGWVTDRTGKKVYPEVRPLDGMDVLRDAGGELVCPKHAGLTAEEISTLDGIDALTETA